MNTVYTIGHGNHDLKHFIEILKEHNVNLLIDVRRRPGSEQFPDFNRESVKRTVEENGIEYFFLGDLIGGDPNFKKYMETDDFRQGFYVLKRKIENKVPAIMCSEFNQFNCHRGFISSALSEEGYDVKHIKKDSSIASQDASLLHFVK